MADAQIVISANTRQAEAALNRMNKSLGGVSRAAAVVASALSIGVLTKYANAVQTIDNRLKLVTDSQQNLNAVFSNLTSVANRSRQDLDAVSDLYQKIALSTKDLGLSQSQVSRTTETFGKLLSIAGAESGTAAGAIRQFSQALGSGAFRGDEFNSVVEAAPQILDILAAETGKARGQIRALAADGKLTADVLINALLKASQDVDAQFAKTAPTIGQSLTVLQNNILQLGRTASPVFTALSKSILLLANNLEKVIVFLVSFGSALAVGKVIAMTRAVGSLTAGIKLLTAAMARNPIGLLAVAIAGAITLAYDFLKPLFQIEAALGTKILYAIERAGNAFLGFFAGIGKAAYEFGKMLVAAINPFDDIDVEDAFTGFGDRLKKSFQEGMDSNIISLISDDDRANINKQIEDLNKSMPPLLGGDDGPVTSNTVSEDTIKAAQKLNDRIVDLQRKSASTLTQIELDKAADILAINTATDEELKQAGMSRNEALAKVEQAYTDILKQQGQTRLQQAQQTYNNELEILNEKLEKGLISNQEYQEQLAVIEAQYLDASTQAELEKIDVINQAKNRALQAEVDRQDKIYQATKTRIENEQFLELQKNKNSALGYERQKEAARTFADFSMKTEEEKTQFAIEQGANMFTALGAHNKKAFEAAKAFNIANAIMNTYMAATKALASYPPPFSFIAAAAAIGMGFAQVAAIRNQQYSGRALGGGVVGGQEYMVGERGPEIFRPSSAGTIIPNDKMGGQPVTVNFNIQANDTAGFDELITSRKQLITGIIRDAQLESGRRF